MGLAYNSEEQAGLMQPENSLHQCASGKAFIENLNLPALATRPVDSGVRLLLSEAVYV